MLDSLLTFVVRILCVHHRFFLHQVKCKNGFTQKDAVSAER